MNRFRNWVGESESAPLEIFTHMGVEQFDQTLQELRDKWEPSAYYRMLIVLDEFIHDDVVPHLHEELENTISEIQQRYDIDTLTIGEANKRALSESVETIIDCVNERHDICEKRLEETNPDFRDILPSMINLFVGEKELLKKEIYQIETDLDRLNNLQQDIKTVENIRTICEQRLEDTKESLESDLANCQEEIQYFQQRQDDRREELNTLDKRITTLRRELSTSQNYGGEHQLALSWESLDELTESKMAELTSLHAFLDKGLLSEDTARVKSAVVDCLERSRSYPDPLSRHTKPLPAVTTSQDIFIRYNEANEPLLNDIEDKLGISDKINLLSSNESRFKGDRYRIEAFSVFQGGNPTNLRGYERLNSSHKNGTLGAMAGHYRNPDRALAYPELHESLTTDEFNIDNNKNSK
jgi:DNA repair exonuclease SbcCD ATPase subunit